MPLVILVLIFQKRIVEGVTAAVAEARTRLDELNAITRANGRPYLAAHSRPDVTEAMPDGWFEDWHPAG